MNEPIVSVRTYLIVLVVLTVLTVATVAISFAPLASHWHLTAGMTIGLVKASLVGIFFMHLIHTKHLNWIIVAAAIFWLLILFVLNLSDYMTRGEVPFMPGH